MNELNFNINGFARPTTRAEISALLREALCLADELDSHLASMEKIMEARTEPASAGFFMSDRYTLN